MKIHIFNPDHDMALAANDSLYVSKKAGRRLAADLAWLPAIYAEEDDAVLIDFEYPSTKEDTIRKLQATANSQCLLDIIHSRRLITCNEVELLPPEQIEFCPWGWNRQIVHRLSKRFPNCTLPSDNTLQLIRRHSSREYALNLIAITETQACHSYAELLETLSRLPEAMVKQPWSGSGRGLRHITQAEKIVSTRGGKEQLLSLEPHLAGWCRNTIRQQGCIMVEPYYNKVMDLAAEFWLDAQGKAHYLGTSVFSVHNGYYTGNILASEEEKTAMIARYVPLATYQTAIAALATQCEGLATFLPFGIDMMIVRQSDGQYRLHSFVELNLRRTMGHVAIALERHLGSCSSHSTMQVKLLNGHYSLAIQ